MSATGTPRTSMKMPGAISMRAIMMATVSAPKPTP
jgi:hypothetical protein